MDSLVRSAMLDFYPSTEHLPGLDQVDLDGFLKQFKKEAPPVMWAGVVAGALAYQTSPILTIGKPTLASKLSPEERDRHAELIGATNVYQVRQLINVLKMMAGLAWGQAPEVRKAMGLEPYPEDPGTWRKA